MGNAPIGNDFIQGCLGVVNLKFNNVDLGKTIGETNIEWIEDWKDILYAQNGTQPYDQIPTGQGYRVTTKLGEPTWTKLQQLMRGITIVGDNVKLGRDIYRSGRTNFAKLLEIFRVDSDGTSYTSDPAYKLTFYKALPKPTGPIGAFGPDNQREVEVEFYIFYDEDKDCFGYQGYASSLGL